MLLNLVRWMIGRAPGFKGYLALYGIDTIEDETGIVGLDGSRARFRRGRGGGGGGGGGGGIGGWLAGLIVVLILAYLAMTLIGEFAPLMGNLTYSGEGIGATIFGLVQDWILPLALIGLLIYVVMTFVRGKGR